MKLLLEAVVVGIATVVVGSVVGFILGKLMGQDLPAECKKWNKNHIMELSLFITGFLIHVLCELVGVNKWYCKNGAACKKNKK